jgi:hypothetical protein
MADVQKEIALKVTTDVGQTTTALKSAEERLGEAKKAMLDLALAGKQGSKEFRALAVEAGALKGKIESVEQTVDGLGKSANKIEVFTGAVQGIAAGFAIAQGTAALFAEGNEELQEALVKVQASLALLQGTEQAVQLLRKESAAGQALLTARTAAYNVVVGASTGALKLFRIALAATGIGLAVVAIGALVANWDKLTKAVTDFVSGSPALTKVLKFIGDTFTSIGESLGFVEKQSVKNLKTLIEAAEKEKEILEAKGKDTARIEQDILNLKLGLANETKEGINEAEQAITVFAAKQNAERAKLDKEATDKKIENSLKVKQQRIADLEAELSFLNQLGKESIDLEETILREKLRYAELTKTGVMQAQAELRLFLMRDELLRQADQKEANKKEFETRVEANKELARINEELRRSKLTDYQREQEDFLAQRAKMMELMRASGASEIELQLFASNTAAMIRNAANEKEVEDAKAKEDKKLSNQKAAIFASIEVAKMGLQGIADLAAFFAGESEAQQKKAFEIQKKVNIATTIIDGVLSAQKAYASLIGTPIVGPVLAPIAAGAAIAASLARVRAIQSTTFGATSAPSNTGGGGGIPTGGGGQQQPPAAFNPNVTPTNPTGQPNPQGGQNGTTRVIVVESDIRRVTTRVDAAERFATFGN